MAAISALAEYPERIKDIFVTEEKNQAGIYAVKFYIRGKPWIVEVDDRLLFVQRSRYYEPYLRMARESQSGLMWGPILEKAWAKLRGSYENADGGLLSNGIRSVTGAPVYLYETYQVRD